MRANRLAFDIGANKGSASNLLLKMGFSRIVAVEANPNLLHRIQKRFSRSKEVKVVSALVSNDCSPKDFFISSRSDGLSTSSLDWINNSRFTQTGNWKPPVKVKSVTMDWLAETHGYPEFVKIDVEGYELKVLQGMSFAPLKIAFEWTDELFETLTLPCLDRLQDLGEYLFSFQEGDNLRKEPGVNSYLTRKKAVSRKPKGKSKWGMVWALLKR